MRRDPHQIVLAPVVTEKSYERAESLRQYTFRVAPDATKGEIARAVESLYAHRKVEVTGVRTFRRRGKKRRATGRRKWTVGRTRDTKRAVVTLAADQMIEVV